MRLVDSSGWLAYFVDEPAADFFAEAIEDADLLVVPSVCIYEVFKVVLRERGEDDALSAAAAMQQGTGIDLDADLAMEAAAVGFEEGLAFADSVIYTVAKRQNATLWTQDAHFIGKSGVQYQAKRIRAWPENAFKRSRTHTGRVVSTCPRTALALWAGKLLSVRLFFTNDPSWAHSLHDSCARSTGCLGEPAGTQFR